MDMMTDKQPTLSKPLENFLNTTTAIDLIEGAPAAGDERNIPPGPGEDGFKWPTHREVFDAYAFVARVRASQEARSPLRERWLAKKMRQIHRKTEKQLDHVA